MSDTTVSDTPVRDIPVRDIRAAGTARPLRLPRPGRLLAGQIRYQLGLLLATPSPLIIGIGFPVILLVAANAKHSALAVPDIAGYAVFGLTVTAWNTHAVRLVNAREAGILKRWRSTPLPPWCYFAGSIITTALFAVAAGMIAVLAGGLIYGTHFGLAAYGGVLVAFMLGAVAWAASSTAIAGVIPKVEAAQPILLVIYFPVVLVSGAFGSVSGEPHWLTTSASYLPAQPLVDAVSHALNHAAGAPLVPGRDAVVLAGWAVAGLVAAIALFRWEPYRPAQRRAARVAS
jgi:ABC-2 type transport system permease protein